MFWYFIIPILSYKNRWLQNLFLPIGKIVFPYGENGTSHGSYALMLGLDLDVFDEVFSGKRIDFGYDALGQQIQLIRPDGRPAQEMKRVVFDPLRLCIFSDFLADNFFPVIEDLVLFQLVFYMQIGDQ